MSSSTSGPTRRTATVFCEGNFAEIDGKTANGLVRQSERYEITSVIDSTKAGRDAGEVLDGVPNGIPIVADLAAAVQAEHPECFIVGVAPSSGLLSPPERAVILEAIAQGLDIVNGLHEFLNDDIEFAAAGRDARRADQRRAPPARQEGPAHVLRAHPRGHLPAHRGARHRRRDRQAHHRDDPDRRAQRRRHPGRDGRHRPDVAHPGRALRRRARRHPGAVLLRRDRGGGRRGVRGRAPRRDHRRGPGRAQPPRVPDLDRHPPRQPARPA